MTSGSQGARCPDVVQLRGGGGQKGGGCVCECVCVVEEGGGG